MCEFVVGKQQGEQASAVLKRIRGTDHVEDELEDIQSSLDKQSGGWEALLKPTVRLPLVVGVGLGIVRVGFLLRNLSGVLGWITAGSLIVVAYPLELL